MHLIFVSHDVKDQSSCKVAKMACNYVPYTFAEKFSKIRCGNEPIFMDPSHISRELELSMVERALLLFNSSGDNLFFIKGHHDCLVTAAFVPMHIIRNLNFPPNAILQYLWTATSCHSEGGLGG